MDLTINIITRRPWIYRLFGFKSHKHTVTIKNDVFLWESSHKHSIVESITMSNQYTPFPTDYIKDFSNFQVVDKDGNTWPIGEPKPNINDVSPKD